MLVSNEPATMPPTRKDTGKGGEKSKVVVGGERQKPEESDAEIFSYEPVRFLRTHSKNNDPNFRDLAHAFSPKHGGEVHFQEAETWTINSRQGINFFPSIFPKYFQSYTFKIAYFEHKGQICCPWLFTKSATHWDCFTPIFNRL